MDDDIPLHESRGILLGFGTSAIVELLSNGKEVIKTPQPGPDYDQCREDMEVEAAVYQRLQKLGPHPRFLRLISFDEANATITLPYMSAGTLRTFLQTTTDIALRQRLQWCLEAAEGMETLHAINVVHWDFSPKNILLDQEDYSLKIADFGCSSIDGKTSSGLGDPRFYPSRSTSQMKSLDIFALGSTMFEILTGVAPLGEVPSPHVGDYIQRGELPTLEAVELRDIVSHCWSASREEQDVGMIRGAVAAAINARNK